MNCRHCSNQLNLQLIDLGWAPPSNAYLTKEQLAHPEVRVPLRVLVCERCWLAQTEDFVAPTDLFDAEYAYFSSYSTSWLAHCKRFAEDAIARFGLGPSSHVVEVASNDGYLLQYFLARGIPSLGIEPTPGPAAAARSKGIPTIEQFFGRQLGAILAAKTRADLTVAINVLAHVPDINDFAAGFAELLSPTGVATFEFPHLVRLVERREFDTIYHEHFSYLSLTAARRVLRSVGLDAFDVEELPTHGGSIRVYAQQHGTRRVDETERLRDLLTREKRAGVESAGYYSELQAAAAKCRDDFRGFLVEQRERGRTVAAYGAAAKGNTLLNYSGIGPELLVAVADANPAKQGKYLPGSHIPIVSEARLEALRPDYVVILPWNLRTEIMAQLAYLGDAGTRFVTAIPRLRVYA